MPKIAGMIKVAGKQKNFGRFILIKGKDKPHHSQPCQYHARAPAYTSRA